MTTSQVNAAPTIDTIWRDVERRYPQPIAVVIRRLRNSTREDWQARANVLTDTLTSTLQYLAAVAFLDCLANVDDQAFAASGMEQLQTPMSDGKWAGLLRDSLQRLAQVEQSFMPELAACYNQGGKRSVRKLIDELVRLRNRLTHDGAGDSQRYSLYTPFNQTLTELLTQLNFLPRYDLVSASKSQSRARVKYHTCRLFTGHEVDEAIIECELDLESFHPLLLNRERGELLDMYPFYVVDEQPFEVRFCRFATISKRGAEFLTSDGQNYVEPDAWQYLQEVQQRRISSRLSPRQLRITTPDFVPEPLPVAPTTSVSQRNESKSGRHPTDRKSESPTQQPARSIAREIAAPTPPVQVATAPEQPDVSAVSAAAQTPRVVLRQRLDGLLERFFRHTREHSDFTTLLSDQLREYLRQREGHIRARLADAFSLVVVGEFKRGKSTLINALLGAEIVPADVTPETVTINKLRYGSALLAEAVLEDGTTIALDPAELRAERLVARLVAIDQAAGVAGGLYRLSSAQLSRLIADKCSEDQLTRLAAAIDCVLVAGASDHDTRTSNLVLAARRERKTRALIAVIQREYPELEVEGVRVATSVSQSFPDLDGAAQRVDHLDIRVPLPWLDRIHLIDTPGLGQVPVFDAQVQDYLAEADAVVFVVSALQPVAESERTFLRQALRVTNGAPMLFVINRIDQIRNANDAKRLIATISARIRTIHPEAPIFALSAQDELDRCVGVAAPETRAALDDFAGFRSALEQSILRNRDLIQIDRAVHDLSALIDEVRASIAYLRKASSVSTDERVARIAQYTDTHSLLHNHIRDQVARVERELAVLAAETIGWMDGFIARFATEALPMINQSTVSDLTQYYIFFLAESVRDALEACLEAQRPIVQALLTDVRVSTQHAIASGVFNSEISERISTLASEAIFGKRAWNGIDTLQFVVDQSVQRLFGTTHHALIQLFSQQVVQRTGEQAHRAAFREQLANALPRLQQSLQVELHALYDDLTRAATTEIVAAAQQEIDTSLTMLRQAAEQPTGAASVQTVVSDRALAWLNQMTDQVRLVEPQFT